MANDSNANPIVKRATQQRQFWLGMLLSALCLAAIFLFIDPGEVVAAMKTADFRYLALTVVGIVIFLAVRAGRWRFMLNNDAPWHTIFHIQNIGYLLTSVLPLRIGDVARAVLIGNVPPITVARGVSTMVVERMLDLLVIVTLLPFTLAEAQTLPTWMREAARGSGALAVAGIAVLIVAANKRPLAKKLAAFVLARIPFLPTGHWVDRTDRLLTGLDSLTRPKDGLILVLLSILTWIPIVLSYFSAMRAVGLEPTIAIAAFVMCAAAFSVAAPSSPGQIGVFHAGVIAALRVQGQPAAESASFAFLYHLINLTTMVMMGLIGFYATGATFGRVLESTQAFMRRQQKRISD